MSASDPNQPMHGRKLVFSSDELPAHLDQRARLKLLRDLFTQRLGPCELAYTSDLPFSARCEFTQFGEIAVTRFATTVQQYARTSSHIAADTREQLLIGFNRGARPQALAQRGRDLVLAPGELALYINTEPLAASAKSDMHVVGVSLPRAQLLERVGHADNLALAPLDPHSPAVWHLGRYLDFLLAPHGFGGDPSLIAYVEGTLLDLAALALGAAGESAEIARMRGLRAARLREIVAQIKAGFADPAFSADAVGAKLGLGGRHVQNLLSETGVSFTERVLELRLQKARAMLADPRHDRLKVSDIAYACGFNEVPYFNRCFRRRFGAAPRQYRGGNGDAGRH
jgi:AraC-like DNA-binding protein